MSHRLRRADEGIGNLVMLDVYGRVARILIDLAEKEGDRQEIAGNPWGLISLLLSQ